MFITEIQVEIFTNFNPDIKKHVLAVRPHLHGLRLWNNRFIKTTIKGMKELTAGETLGRKLTTNQSTMTMVG